MQQTTGPRSRKNVDKILAIIEEEFQAKKTAEYEESRKVDYSTTTHDTYNKPGFTPFL